MTAIRYHMVRALMPWLAVATAVPALAQTRTSTADQDDQSPQVQPLRPQTPTIEGGSTGRIAGSAVGVAGQRQTREQAAPNMQPTARIAIRIQNRVQNRVRNRIDRYYDPQANATAPFATATDQLGTEARPRR